MPLHPPWSFDIDRFINPFLLPPPWKHIPYPVAWFLGHRKSKPRDIGNLAPIFWACIGIFCAISIIEETSRHVPAFHSRGAPLIVGSFGAAAVLEFYSIESPLAQPRNAIFGQVVASIVGVAVCKLFRLSDDFGSIRWAGGALACAAATSLMALTKTVHPPAGATALLAVVDDDIVGLGWWLIPVMLLGCALMLGVALLINNIERRFPIYWWTADDLTTHISLYKEKHDPADPTPAKQRHEKGNDKDVEANTSEASTTEPPQVPAEIVIRPGGVNVPEHIYMTQEEKAWLESLCSRLQ